MTRSSRLFQDRDWLPVLLRLLLVGLAIALALAPSLATGTPTVGPVGWSPAAPTGASQMGGVTPATNASALPPTEPPPGVPPPDFGPGSDCAFRPGGFIVL
jgi:hypothetical protein